MAHMAVLFQLLLLLVPLALLLLRFASQSRRRSQKQLPLPPSPPGLPVIGHLHLIGSHPHVSIRSLAAKHGGLMLLRLGTVPYLIVSSPRAAQLILRTHDHVFASRAPSTVCDALLYGASDVGFSPYGEHWRKVRRLVTTHLLTVKKVQSFCFTRREEVRLVMAKIQEAAGVGKAVDISEMMNAFANDIMCLAVSSKFSRIQGRNKVLRELIEMNPLLFGGFNLEAHFPGLAHVLSLLTGWFVSNKTDEVHKRWDELLERMINDHEKWNSSKDSHGPSDDEQQDSDFIDALLSVQQEYGITRDTMKAILMDVFGAGTDTSALVLEFSMAELMRNPQVMTKLQDEVRNNTPKGQEMVEQDNIASMTYLKAVVKETLRLHPPGPLLNHFSMVDCNVDGYTIPSGTRVIVNAWAISRDPKFWEKAEDFMPERFMDGGSAASIDFRGNDFQFVPFGAGRRICPGLNFALADIEILLANLVYCFDWGLPAGMRMENIDMTEVFGLTIRLKKKVILVPKRHDIV